MAWPDPSSLTSECVPAVKWRYIPNRGLNNRTRGSYLRYLSVVCLAGRSCGQVSPCPREPERRKKPPRGETRTLAVVTHVENDVVSVSRSELARIFLKQQTVWPGRRALYPYRPAGR